MVRAEKAMYPDFDSVVAQTEAWWERQPKPTLVMNFDVGLSVGDQRLRGILKVDQFFATDWVLQHQRPPQGEGFANGERDNGDWTGRFF